MVDHYPDSLSFGLWAPGLGMRLEETTQLEVYDGQEKVDKEGERIEEPAVKRYTSETEKGQRRKEEKLERPRKADMTEIPRHPDANVVLQVPRKHAGSSRHGNRYHVKQDHS